MEARYIGATDLWPLRMFMFTSPCQMSHLFAKTISRWSLISNICQKRKLSINRWQHLFRSNQGSSRIFPLNNKQQIETNERILQNVYSFPVFSLQIFCVLSVYIFKKTAAFNVPDLNSNHLISQCSSPLPPKNQKKTPHILLLY